MSFSTALSGLNAAQSNLDVVSNNIANSNTHGFKSARVEFADVYAVSQTGGTRNAIGKGVRVAAVDQQFTQGDIELTANNLDLAINGNGFFRLSDNGTTVYSRAGSFGLDREGYLVNGSNQRLTGLQADSNGIITSALGDLRVSLGDSAPQPTAAISMAANLDAAEAIPVAFDVTNPLSYNHSASSTIYDSLGASHVSTFYFRKDALNTWEAFTYIDSTPVSAGADVLGFDTLGQLSQINGAAVSDIVMPAYSAGNGSAPINLTLDASEFTQFGGGFGLNAIVQDGFASGRMTSIDVDESGVVLARFSNGRAGALGQIVLTNFANVDGLRAEGDTSFSETYSSGSALTATPGTTSLGLLQSGAIEQSNVDLTRELVNMITAQRSFQANAKVISTNEELTQTVINITR